MRMAASPREEGQRFRPLTILVRCRPRSRGPYPSTFQTSCKSPTRSMHFRPLTGSGGGVPDPFLTRVHSPHARLLPELGWDLVFCPSCNHARRTSTPRALRSDNGSSSPTQVPRLVLNVPPECRGTNRTTQTKCALARMERLIRWRGLGEGGAVHGYGVATSDIDLTVPKSLP
jgi:hypothetical protein